MIPILTEFGIAIAAHVATDAAKEGIKRAFTAIGKIKPEIEARAKAARASGDATAIQKVLSEAIGAILAEAGTGQIAVDGAAITALSALQFDHQNGRVDIANAVLRGETIQVGGSAGATGHTKLGGDTSLRSNAGAGIEIGKGAGLSLSGGAGI